MRRRIIVAVVSDAGRGRAAGGRRAPAQGVQNHCEERSRDRAGKKEPHVLSQGEVEVKVGTVVRQGEQKKMWNVDARAARGNAASVQKELRTSRSFHQFQVSPLWRRQARPGKLVRQQQLLQQLSSKSLTLAIATIAARTSRRKRRGRKSRR